MSSSRGDTFTARRGSGFTLLEVLVSVAILGLVATASLRLSIISSRTLAEAEVQRTLLDRSRELQLKALGGTLPESGSDKKLRWRMMKSSIPIMGGLWDIRYRSLEVEYEGRNIELYIP